MMSDSAQARVTVKEAVFKEFGEDAPALGADGPAAPMDLLLDIPLQLTVELGRVRRMIKEVLALTPGSVVELDRLAGEPVDVLVNGRLLGKGEVVVINENFGVRITDILSPTERIEQLN
jgi:flagellar motor switch protein FliN/FliY